MSDEFRPRHLRHVPPNVQLTTEEEREHMDLQTDLDRVRRRHLSEQAGDKEPWAFPVPRPMALLFDRLPTPFVADDALSVGEALGMDAPEVEEAVGAMKAHELVSRGPGGYVKHPENRNWF